MNKVTDEFNLSLYKGKPEMIKQNKASIFKNTDEDKLAVMSTLDQRTFAAGQKSNAPIGTKNLVYYCVYGVDYTMLLDLSLKTLIKHTPVPNFDVLIMTDRCTEKMIRSLEVISKFNVSFYIEAPPVDGVTASMTKLRIYNYANINDYKQVLFLDTDILCNDDINFLFNFALGDKLEVVRSPLMGLKFKMKELILTATLSHGLCFFRDHEKQFILDKDPYIFNAGQFMFINTERMRSHFENVMWLMDNWPAAYFFEQSFVNHYFNLKRLASYKYLDKHVSIFRSVPNIRVIRSEDATALKQHDESHSLFHFAGTPTDGRNKYQFMKLYCGRYDICL